MTNTERALAYLENTLSEKEKLAFERDLEGNKSLNEEFNFQSEVIEGIKIARKAELKAMLNNIQVGGNHWYQNTTAQWLTGIASIAVLSIGLYLYFPSDSENSVNEPTAIENEPSQPELKPDEEIANLDNREDTEKIQEQTRSIEKKSNDETKRQITTPTTNSNESDNSDSEIDFSTPEPLEDISQSTEDTEIKVPDNNEITTNEGSNLSIELITDSRKYDFHYQFFNNSLKLYGDFDSPYEILDLQRNQTRLLYLYYDLRYFNLDPSSKDINSLKPVQDQSLIKQLEKMRTEN